MTPRRYVVVVAAVAAQLVGCVAAAAADLTVTTDRSRIDTQLGRDFEFRTIVTNDGSTATEPLVAHLNILSLHAGVYVDPEDWSTQRTYYLGSIAAGDARTITWRIKAVNDGEFAAYAAVLGQRDPSAAPPASGDAVQVVVARRTTLSASGILPLALGIPALVAALAGAAHIARRRATAPGSDERRARVP